jgi:hypothetical protein
MVIGGGAAYFFMGRPWLSTDLGGWVAAPTEIGVAAGLAVPMGVGLGRGAGVGWGKQLTSTKARSREAKGINRSIILPLVD